MFLDAHGHVVRALTIAGSDSGGGAGIQADLKTFAAYDVYGMSAITALTAQNTQGVEGVEYVSADFVRAQLDAISTDLGTDAVKIGMLGRPDIIRAVTTWLQATMAGVPVVVDPVMVAKGGARLIDADAVATLLQHLLPVAHVVTPNIPEAEVLWGLPILSWADCLRAARALAERTPAAIVIKGGHAQAEWLADTPWDPVLTADMAVDMAYVDGQFTYFATPRIATQKTHGTGCTFSSAVAAGLARGADVVTAIASAKSFIHVAIVSAQAWDVGHGHGPVDHSVSPLCLTQQIEVGAAYRLRDGGWERLDS